MPTSNATAPAIDAGVGKRRFLSCFIFLAIKYAVDPNEAKGIGICEPAVPEGQEYLQIDMLKKPMSVLKKKEKKIPQSRRCPLMC